MRALFLMAVVSAGGCYSTTVQPGHLGLLFEPRAGGLQRETLKPGYHKHTRHARVDDFDITYSTKKEEVRTKSSEGLDLDLRVAVIYRPVLTELYELDTEIGQNYYDEVIGPEFRSAARGVFAHHSYLELQSKNEKIEDEIETELRRRCGGKHVEVSSVTMEEVNYAPEIAEAIRSKLVGEQEAIRKKASMEADDLREKMTLRHEEEKAKMRALAEVAAKQHEQELETTTKKHEHEMAEEQAAIDKIKAAADAEEGVTRARAEAEEAKLMAEAHAAENRAETHSLTPLAVMDHAYEALGKLGGSGTTIMLGDFAQAPKFLFPQFGPFGNPFSPAAHKADAEATAKAPIVRPTPPNATMDPGLDEGDDDDKDKDKAHETRRKTHARRNKAK